MPSFFFDAGAKNCDISVPVSVSSVVFFWGVQQGRNIGIQVLYSSVHCASVCGVFCDVCKVSRKIFPMTAQMVHPMVIMFVLKV